MTLRRLAAGVRFSTPARNRIVILYADDHWIRSLVLRDLPATTLKLYPDAVHVSLTLVFGTLARLRHLKWPASGAKSLLKALMRQIYEQYILACIDRTGACLVLTSIDNATFFQSLSRIDRKRTYFAIQNGTRTLTSVRDSVAAPFHPTSVISMTNFFCFGQRDADLFRRHGHQIDEYFPVGSLIGGYYRTQHPAPAQEREFDLCLISQWHPHFFEEITGEGLPYAEYRWTAAGINAVNGLLRQLLEETDLRLIVCPRNDQDAAEVAFFRDALGANVTFANADRKAFSTYRTIDRSRIAIALNSTVLLEAFSWGQKVLWCNATTDEHFEMPEAGVSYFHGEDYAAFRDRVLALLSMPQAEYEALTRDKARYINNFDPACPPHEAIRSRVLTALSGTAWSNSAAEPKCSTTKPS